MTTTTFRQWLQSQRGRDDAIGDVAKAIARDDCMIADDYRAMRDHMNDAHDPEGRLVDAFDDAHAEYERSDDPPRPPPEPLSTH
jgi:hypothetical protein